MVVQSILLSYLIGSIPFAYIFTRLFKHTDIREVDTKNVGTANVVKNIGIVPGILTMVGDVGKGAVVALIGMSEELRGFGSILPAFAVAGHNWPVWLRFKGGGGLATLIGAAIAQGYWFEMLIAVGIWGISYLLINDHDWSAVAACISAIAIYNLTRGYSNLLLFFNTSGFVILMRRVECMIKRAHEQGEAEAY